MASSYPTAMALSSQKQAIFSRPVSRLGVLYKAPNPGQPYGIAKVERDPDVPPDFVEQALSTISALPGLAEFLRKPSNGITLVRFVGEAARPTVLAGHINGLYDSGERSILVNAGKPEHDFTEPGGAIAPVLTFLARTALQTARTSLIHEIGHHIESLGGEAVSARIKQIYERAEPVEKFNPDQPRDEHGRWTSGGSAGEPAAAPSDLGGVIASYRPAFESTRKDISENLSQFGTVEARLKSEASLSEKIYGRGNKLENINDIMGFRVTTNSVADAKAATDRLSQLVEARGGRVLSIDNKMENPRSGYRAIHVDIQTKDGKRGEVQIRTENQSRWAIWAHDRIYKSTSESRSVLQPYAERVSESLYRMDRGERNVSLPQAPAGIPEGDRFSMSLPSRESPR